MKEVLPRKRLRRIKSSKNFYHSLTKREILGNTLHFHSIPKSIFVRPDDERDKLQLAADELVYTLSLTSACDNWEEFRKNAEELLQLCDGKSSILNSGLGFQLINNLLDILVLDLFGIRQLELTKSLPQEKQTPPEESLKFDPERKMDIKLLLQLVHVFIFQVPSACLHHFRFKHRLIEVLFTLFSETEHGIYMIASAISEELLLYCSLEKNPTLFSLKSIQTLPNIVCNLKDGPLSHFHHIISSVLSDPELTAPSVSLEQHDQWLNDTSTSQIVDSNQEVLFRLPNHFEKICANSCRPVSSVGRSIELLAHVLGRTINILDFEESDAQFMERFGSSNSYFSQVTMLNDAVNRADLLLILSLLLSGKFHKEVQERMIECNFVDQLYKAFEDVIWQDTMSPLPISDDENEISPISFLRIQFLRLVHAIANNQTYRYHLLSIDELWKLKQLAEERSIPLPPQFPPLDDSVPLSTGGLLTAIALKLKQESYTSCVRFWISRVLEAFLRGLNNPINQAFLMEKNLVEDTVEVLTSMKPMHEMVRQGCFDLLSTIMKLNVEAFTKCDAALDSPRKFQTFISSVDDSLVDSNMFIRSLILTVHNIHTNDPDQTDLLMTNRLFKHYCSHEQRIQVVARLIGILDVSSLSQETVSCLNTSLLLLIIAHRNGKLASYLQCLFGVYEPSVLENLHNLLQFWLVHYNLPFKENDRKCLEQSSLTNFPEWTAVTEKLLEQDITSETSIKHYLAKSEEIGRAHGSADLPYIRWP